MVSTTDISLSLLHIQQQPFYLFKQFTATQIAMRLQAHAN